MAKKQHSLGYQALNQARTASHARGFITGFSGLVLDDPSLSKAFHAYGSLFSMARKAMLEMAIINAASVMDKQESSTGMFRLIGDVRVERPELTDFCKNLECRLNAHRTTFTKAVQLRSNIIAHRSKQLTYKEVQDKAALNPGELAAAINVWVDVAQELSMELRGQRFWATYELQDDALRLLKDIAAGLMSD